MTFLEVVFSIALAFAAIFSPAFVSHENHKFQLKINQQLNEQTLKMKELDFYYNTRASAISSFLETISVCVFNPCEDNLQKYLVASAKAYIYLPKKAQEYIDIMEYEISQNQRCDLKNDFYNLLKTLSENSVE